MMGDKARMISDAIVKAQVLARRVAMAHEMSMLSKMQIIQMQMMEKMKNEPTGQPVLPNPQRQ